MKILKMTIKKNLDFLFNGDNKTDYDTNANANEDIMTLQRAQNFIEKERTNPTTDYKERLCYYVNQRSPWDLELIKKTFLAQANYYLSPIENQKKETEKTRSLTEKEISDYTEIKRLFDLEKKEPKRPSFKACDKFMSNFKNNLYNEAELFKYNKKELGEEYKNATFENKSDYLKEYFSNILQAKIAVIKTTNIKKSIKEALNYKWFIIEKVNWEWKVVWFYLFVKNITISDKTTIIDNFDNNVLTSDYLAKIYKKINAEMWVDSWWKAAPITKVFKDYYFYNIYKN